MPRAGPGDMPLALRLSDGLCGEDTLYERGVGHELNPAHTSAAQNVLSATVYSGRGSKAAKR